MKRKKKKTSDNGFKSELFLFIYLFHQETTTNPISTPGTASVNENKIYTC